ncbi:MAG: hypothetical protein HY208_05915 [Nitrospirae bacterium]|nr:hypothetical protein [Nitrospirota bacterium]
MTARDFGNIALKVLGIFSLFYAVQYIPVVLGTAGMRNYSGSSSINVPVLVASQALALFLYLGIGWWLLTRSERMSLKLFPASEATGFHLSSETFQAVVFSAAGILILSDLIPVVSRIIHQTALIPAGRPLFREFWHQNAESFLVFVMQLSLGLYFFFGSRGIARVWHRLSTHVPEP